MKKTYYVNLAADLSAYALEVPVEAENEEDLERVLREKSSELSQLEMEVNWETLSGFRAISFQGEQGGVVDFKGNRPLPLAGKLYWDIGQDVVWLYRQLTDGLLDAAGFASAIADTIEARTPK